MFLGRALLLLHSTSVVAGFAPCRPVAFSVKAPRHSARTVSHLPVSGSIALQSEVEEASEAVGDVGADAPDAEEFDKSIYIGNISFDAVESELRAAFSEHGTVKKLQMPLDRNTGRSRGFAFVTMSNADEHANAIESMNESEVGGRTIYVSESLPKDKVAENKKKYTARKSREVGTKIYVGNLNFETSSEDLQAAFSQYGEVHDCYLPLDFDGNTRGFAFIRMDDEDALKAIEELNGSELDGRTLNVNKSLPKGTKSTPKQVKLYVGNLSWGTEEDVLRGLFEEYGKVIDCYIPVDRETGQHRGFAFVTMDPDDALRAADETDGYELDGRILRVNEAQPKGSGRYNSYNDGYDGGDAYDEAEDESWGNDSY